MKPSALGFRVHSGWSAMVAISLEEDSPQVILRDRPHLVQTFSFEFRQPYHTAEKRSFEAGREFIAQVRTEARGLASRIIRSVSKNLEERGYEIKCCGLLTASGKTLPALPQILASHALIHTADGELFREAVLYACKKCGFKTFTMKEKEVGETAARTLRLSANGLAERLSDLGRTCGSPWTQDEKLAAAAAWLAMLGPAESLPQA